MQYVLWVSNNSTGSLIAFRLNIFYLILEKMNNFAEEAKYDVTNISGNQITANYEEARTDAWNQIESLNIAKRIISTCAYFVFSLEWS